MEQNRLDIKHVLKAHAYQNIPLNFDEAYILGLLALDSCRADDKLPQIQSISALCALHNQATYRWSRDESQDPRGHTNGLPKNAAEQIAGICAAIFKEDIARSEFGYLKPKVEFAMDNCGMGGDWVKTANVSTLAALIAASAGIPMCKHGSPANTDAGHYGSSDFVGKVCQINTMADKAMVERAIETLHFGYTEALDTSYKHIHLQTHQIARLPHMNDIIGPITNPLHRDLHTRRIVGVNHLIPPQIAAEAYMILNAKKITNLRHGLFIRGFVNGDKAAGMDELSICSGGTEVVEIKDGQITHHHLYASDFDLVHVPADTISPKGDKGQFSLAILKGEVAGPPLQMVLANAALLFYLAGRSGDLKECYRMGQDANADRKAYEHMMKISSFLK